MSAKVGSARRRSRFRIALILVALAGVVFRVAYVAIDESHPVGGDGRYYHAIATLVATGKGFIDPKPFMLQGLRIAGAPHPPAWPLVLTGAALVGLRTVLEQQLIACLVGAATIVMVGLAGRRLAGGRVGIIAAALAAGYANFWLYERELMSETLTLLGAATVVFLAYRYRERPGRARALLLGLGCGVLAVTHAEQLLLVVVLLVPLIWFTHDLPRATRLRWAAGATAVAAAVVLPWAAYNTARFHKPVLLGTEFGITAAVTNCPETYSGPHLGFQDVKCRDDLQSSGRIKSGDAVTIDDQYRRIGLQYARDHLGRLPVVVLAREARTWNVPVIAQWRNDVGRGTSIRVIELGFAQYYVLFPFAVAGVVILRRRRVIVWPLLTFAVTVTVGTALTYGFTRFRAAAEVPLVLLAAVAVDALIRRLLRPAPAAED